MISKGHLARTGMCWPLTLSESKVVAITFHLDNGQTSQPLTIGIEDCSFSFQPVVTY